jgi:exopolysaccharide production protein ExoZ
MHYRSIHALRGVAAALVVIFHTFYSLDWMRPLMGPIGWTRFGVDIFFVISGFVMVASTTGRSTSPAQFLTRRLARIVPLYWLVIIAFAMVMPTWTGGQLAASLLFLPSENALNGLLQPVLPPGWTLNLEMFFYLLFAGALILPEKLRVPAVTTTLILICCAHLVWPDSSLLGFYGDSLVLSFALGMVIAQYGVRLHWAFAFLGLLLLANSGTFQAPRIIAQGLPAAMIVSGALSLERYLRDNAAINLAGDASYAIYLVHLPVVLGVASLLNGHIQPGIGAALILIASGIMIGVLVHVLIERPVMRDIQKLLYRNRRGMIPGAKPPANSSEKR